MRLRAALHVCRVVRTEACGGGATAVTAVSRVETDARDAVDGTWPVDGTEGSRREGEKSQRRNEKSHCDGRTGLDDADLKDGKTRTYFYVFLDQRQDHSFSPRSLVPGVFYPPNDVIQDYSGGMAPPAPAEPQESPITGGKLPRWNDPWYDCLYDRLVRHF